MLIQIMLVVMLAVLVVALGFIGFVLKELYAERQDRRALKDQLQVDAHYDCAIGADGRPVKLAANYAALRSMSESELLRAASYLEARERYLAKLERDSLPQT